MAVIDGMPLYDNIVSGAQKDGRGNICPSTIILPTLAMEAEGNKEKFFEILDKMLNLTRDSLIARFEWISSQSPKAASFMWENNTMSGYVPSEGIRSAMRHGTLAVGLLGIAECLQILIGKDQTEQEGMELAKQILSRFQDKCSKWKKKYKLNFGVYYTPAENLAYTAMNKFKAKYGVIPNVSDKKYFTNSVHVPVWKQMDPFKKIDIETELMQYSSAGSILYVELDSTVKNNIDALETIVNYAMEHDCTYFAVNTPNDTCTECGYQGEINDTCPQCGSNKIDRLRRVTGYITGNYTTAFNDGKKEEVEDRVKHRVEF